MFEIVKKKNHAYLRMIVNSYKGELHADYRIYGVNTDNPYAKVEYIGKVYIKESPELLEQLRKIA